MMNFLGKLVKFLFALLFICVFVFVASKLFFEEELNLFIEKAKVYLKSEKIIEKPKIEVFRIVYPDEPISLEPTRADPTTRQRLNNIYESLVITDRDLKIKPALALNWGLLNDYTWEFKLRPNIKFHDGSNFEVSDVEASFYRALKYPNSELSGLLSTIEKIDILDSLTFRIKTKDPDPLLLQRLAMILIIPSEYKEKELTIPIGTGSYKFISWEKGKEMKLSRFEDYWGEKSKFKEVHIFSSVDKFERVKMLFEDKVDFIAFVPYDGVDVVKENNFNVVTVPSLEVQFLLFNQTSKYFKDIRNKQMVSYLINQDDLIKAIGGYARRVSQFVSSGIFGFNPYILDHEYNLEKAKKIAEETKISGKTLQFHLAKGLTVLGDYLRKQMSETGISLVVSYLDESELLDDMSKKKADIYFLGFKSGIGDSSTFLYYLAHSNGPYNFLGYKNDLVDKLITSSLVEMDDLGRRKSLQDAMEILVKSDILGVPLFEYETVYAFNNKINIYPRIDGIIIFDELIVK